MKKLLSSALALIMIATTLFALPFTAHAEEYVDLSNELQFGTLEELRNAITKGSNDNTLVLTKDIDLTSNEDENVLFNNRQTFIFDLNGHNITVDSSKNKVSLHNRWCRC